MSDLHEAIQGERAKYPPDSRSAVLPALRLAQARHGWLPPDVLREVAEALDETPAYVHSIASFYDQFHLRPVGESREGTKDAPSRVHGERIAGRGCDE